MIVEERIYTLVVSEVQTYFGLYEAEGMPIQTRILPRMLGYFQTEIGPLNQAVHLWGYEDLAERTRARATLTSDPGWQRYVAKVRPLILSMENKILVPTRFSPIR